MRDALAQDRSLSRGFALLIASLVASVVLLLASAIFDIAQKQVMLASISQQSQYAFYAADTGAECALYWDDRFGYFAPVTPTKGGPTDPDNNLPPICDTQSLAVSNVNSTPTFPFSSVNPASYPYTLTFKIPLSNGDCTIVTIQKCLGSISDNGICSCSGGSCTTISTQVRANGFNTSCTTISSNPIALERTVVLNY